VIVWALFEMSPPKVEQARNLAHEIDPTDAVLLAFIDDYAAFATAQHQWVKAESAATGELRGDIRLLAQTVDAHEQFPRVFADDWALVRE
jgi:hypothetical protein